MSPKTEEIKLTYTSLRGSLYKNLVLGRLIFFFTNYHSGYRDVCNKQHYKPKDLYIKKNKTKITQQDLKFN